jgi:hypothetical protein
LIRTPNGLVAAGQLLVGDQVVTLSFNGLPDDYSYDGTPAVISEEDFANAQETLATVTNLGIHESVGAVVVNSDIYSMTHCIIAKRDGLIQPIMSADILPSDLIYNYNEKSFIPIENLEKNSDGGMALKEIDPGSFLPHGKSKNSEQEELYSHTDSSSVRVTGVIPAAWSFSRIVGIASRVTLWPKCILIIEPFFTLFITLETIFDFDTSIKSCESTSYEMH